VVGGVIGWLAGTGALAVAGLGPLLIAGPIVATLAGIGFGGTLGGLKEVVMQKKEQIATAVDVGRRAYQREIEDPRRLTERWVLEVLNSVIGFMSAVAGFGRCGSRKFSPRVIS
jgi:hypothetical protein